MKALLQLLAAISSGDHVNASDLLDALAQPFPLISSMANTPQDAMWHAEGNVRIHTEMVIAEAQKICDQAEGSTLTSEERITLILGAALHDIGKTLTTREAEIDGQIRIISPHHPERGRSYLAPRMPLLGLPWPQCDQILGLVGYHHEPGKLVARAKPERAYRQITRAVDIKLVYLLELADLRGRSLADAADDRDGFDTLELFRSAAADYGLLNPIIDFYRSWIDIIDKSIESPAEANYVFQKAIRDYESGLIVTPEEAIARTYKTRSHHPELVILCGVSGSGKSTWVDQFCSEHERINLDELRSHLGGKPDDQRKNGQVLQAAKAELRQHLRDKKRIVWDATTLRRNGRSALADLAHNYHARTTIVSIPCPPNWIAKQMKSRSRKVPNTVIARQFERLQWPEVWEADECLTWVPEK